MIGIQASPQLIEFEIRARKQLIRSGVSPSDSISHYRIKLGDVLGAHDNALAFGGLEGIRDLASIESAIGRPYTGYYRSIHRKAAALVESIARNHGFIDGNKRTAFLLVDLLIHRSGYRYKNELTSNEWFRGLEDLIVRIANDVHPPFEEIVEWFKQNVEKA